MTPSLFHFLHQNKLKTANKYLRGNLSLSCEKITSPDPKAECGNYARGSDMLNHFHYEEGHVLRNFLALLALMLIAHILAFVILTLKMWRKRK